MHAKVYTFRRAYHKSDNNVEHAGPAGRSVNRQPSKGQRSTTNSNSNSYPSKSPCTERRINTDTSSDQKKVQSALLDINTVYEKSIGLTYGLSQQSKCLENENGQLRSELENAFRAIKTLEADLNNSKGESEKAWNALNEQKRKEAQFQEMFNQFENKQQQWECDMCAQKEDSDRIASNLRASEEERIKAEEECMNLHGCQQNMMNDLENKENLINELKSALAKCCQNNESLQKDVSDLQNSVYELQGNVERERNERNSLQESLVRMERDGTENMTRCMQAQNEISRLKSTISNMEAEKDNICKETNEIIRAHHTELDSLADKVESTKRMYEEERASRENLERKLRDCEERKRRMEDESRNTQSSFQGYNRNYDSKQSSTRLNPCPPNDSKTNQGSNNETRSDNNDKVTELNEEVKELNEEVEELKTRNEQLSHVKVRLEESNKKLTTNLEMTQNQIVDMTEENLLLHSQLKSAWKDNKKLQSQQITDQSNLETLKSELVESKSRLEDEVTRRETLAEKIANFGRNHLEASLEQQQDLEAAQEETKRLQMTREIERARVDSLERELSEVRKLWEAETAAKNELLSKIAHYDQDQSEIQKFGIQQNQEVINARNEIDKLVSIQVAERIRTDMLQRELIDTKGMWEAEVKAKGILAEKIANFERLHLQSNAQAQAEVDRLKERYRQLKVRLATEQETAMVLQSKADQYQEQARLFEEHIETLQSAPGRHALMNDEVLKKVNADKERLIAEVFRLAQENAALQHDYKRLAENLRHREADNVTLKNLHTAKDRLQEELLKLKKALSDRYLENLDPELAQIRTQTESDVQKLKNQLLEKDMRIDSLQSLYNTFKSKYSEEARHRQSLQKKLRTLAEYDEDFFQAAQMSANNTQTDEMQGNDQ